MTEIHETATGTAEKTSVVGDRTKLREALEHMVRAETHGSMERDDLCGRCLEKMFAKCNHDGTCWVDKAITALAAPPRNCDVGTPKQQAKRFQKFCLGHQPKEGDCTCACPAFVGKDVDCHFSWAQMPYEAGGTK